MKQKNLNKLPKPDLPYGYSATMVVSICEERGIDVGEFWDKFGVNTCAVTDGKINYYPCDVERTLFMFKAPGGKARMWD